MRGTVYANHPPIPETVLLNACPFCSVTEPETGLKFSPSVATK